MDKLTPQAANTTAKICKLKRDNISTKTAWILVGEKTVTLAKQKKGEPSDGMVTISKKSFDKFIKFYLGN